MKRLTFEGNFCDIAMCGEVQGGSFCEDGVCSQRKIWEQLKKIEDIFVAMIEQSLSGGEMKPQKDQRFNGRYAVVYFDPKKWSSPLIDICGTPYNREEAEERMKVLKAALRREQDG